MSRSPSRTSFAKDPCEVAGMFDVVIHRYDLPNDAISLFQVHMRCRVMYAAVAARPEARVLDLVVGTDTSSVRHAVDGTEVMACDFSTGMVAKGECRHPEIALMVGDAMTLPFADESFDVVTISYELYSAQGTAWTLSEMCRVMMPGGRIATAELFIPV